FGYRSASREGPRGAAAELPSRSPHPRGIARLDAASVVEAILRDQPARRNCLDVVQVSNLGFAEGSIPDSHLRECALQETVSIPVRHPEWRSSRLGGDDELLPLERVGGTTTRRISWILNVRAGGISIALLEPSVHVNVRPRPIGESDDMDPPAGLPQR